MNTEELEALVHDYGEALKAYKAFHDMIAEKFPEVDLFRLIRSQGEEDLAFKITSAMSDIRFIDSGFKRLGLWERLKR